MKYRTQNATLKFKNESVAKKKKKEIYCYSQPITVQQTGIMPSNNNDAICQDTINRYLERYINVHALFCVSS